MNHLVRCFALLFAVVLGTVTAAHAQTFITSGTYTVPSGVTSLKVECWGGGGGGGGCSDNNGNMGGGGAGGAYKTATISVTPGQMITYTVGAGGVGVSGAAGGAGAASTFSTVTANGGLGGAPGIGNNNFGVGAVTTTGDFNGGAGSDGFTANPDYSGAGGGGAGNGGNGAAASAATGGAGGAGAIPGGGGANGRTTLGNGIAATALSGAGSGGFNGNGAGNTAVRTGGNGFRGQITIVECALPTADAGPDQTTCVDGTVQLNGIVGGSATGGTWSDGGAGGSFLPDATTLNAFYVPLMGNMAPVTLTLTTSGPCPPQASDNLLLTFLAPTTLALTATGPATALCGDIITVTVQAASGFIDMGSLQFSLNWNLSELSYISHTVTAIGGGAPSTVLYPASPPHNQMTYSWFDPAGFDGEDLPNGTVLVSFSFQVTGSTGNAVLTINGNPTPIEAMNAAFCLVPVTTAPSSTALSPIAVTCPANPPIVCPNAAPFALTGGMPLGGVYSGAGVSAGMFSAVTAGVGMHTITYTYTSGPCTNTCTFVITVGDVTFPLATAPTTIDIECGNAAPIGATTHAGFLAIGGTASDNCTPNASLLIAYTDGPLVGTNCSGTIARTYTVSDAYGNTTTVTQTITVSDNTFPLATAPTTIDIECGNAAPVGATTHAGFLALGGTASDNCTANASLAVAYTDGLLVGTNCSGSIARTYTVTDLCGNTTTVTQTITVSDNTFPLATAPTTIDIECGNAAPVGATTHAGFLALGGTASDNCTANASLAVAYTDGLLVGTNCNGSIARTYTVTDLCGNTTTVTQTITVTDNTIPVITRLGSSPVFICQNQPYTDAGATASDNCAGNLTGSIVTVNPVNTAIPGTYTVTYNVSDPCSNAAVQVTRTVTVNALPVVDAGTYPAVCTVDPDVTLVGTPSGGTFTGTGVTGNMFDPSVGTQTITYTYTDGNGCTNSDMAVITVTVCTFISGKLIWEGDRLGIMTGVNSATVNLTGDDTDSDVTGIPGTYDLFADMGVNFMIKPVKNKPMPDAINGLTAADASRIQQHVTGAFPLTDPYKIIAADPNKTNSVTSADANLVQQAILGNPGAQQFFINTTWRFVPKAYVFPIPANPFVPLFPEKITITGMSGSLGGQDFIGVKTGDVNSSANPVNKPSGPTPNLVWKVQDHVLEQDATITAEFRTENFDNLLALQFGIHFDPTMLEFLQIETIAGSPMQMGNFGLYKLDEGEIRAFLALAEGKTIANGTPSFRLKFKVLQGGSKLSDVLQLNNAVLLGECYLSDYTPGPVGLVYESQISGTKDLDASTFSLLQNRPNPFRDKTVIGFILPEDCEAQIRIFDINGRLVMEQKGLFARGYNEQEFQLDGILGDGIMYYELVTPYGALSKKMSLLKD